MVVRLTDADLAPGRNPYIFLCNNPGPVKNCGRIYNQIIGGWAGIMKETGGESLIPQLKFIWAAHMWILFCLYYCAEKMPFLDDW